MAQCAERRSRTKEQQQPLATLAAASWVHQEPGSNILFKKYLGEWI